MTVRELVDRLMDYDPGAVVVIMDPEYGSLDPVTSVDVPTHDYRIDKSTQLVELGV